MTAAIDYGDRARLGVLLPSGNVVAEAEIRAMLPPGVGHHVTRLALRGSSDAELLGMLDALEPAARLLADARPNAIAFHCTAVSTFAPAMAGDITRRIEDATGLPAFSTADALLAACAALAARRVLLVTPYVAGVHRREIDFLAANGLQVTGGAWMGIDGNAEMGRLTPEAILRFATDAHADADLCLLSCTAIRSAGIIAAAERALGMPVLTSNQAMVWHALRVLNVAAPVPGYGRLLADQGSGAAA